MLTGTLPFDDESVQILFKKIRSGVYSTPDYLSRSVADLISKMLTVDPLKRATVKEIKEHEWFKENLADYLFPSPSQDNLNIFDLDAVLEICDVDFNKSINWFLFNFFLLKKFNVDEETVQFSLSNGDPHDQFVIAYHLIVDNKRINEAHNRIKINDFFVASSPPTGSFFMDIVNKIFII